VSDLELVVIDRDRVDFLEESDSFGPGVREDELEVEFERTSGGGGRETVSDEVEEEFDPGHERGEEVGSFGVDFVDEGVEGLFVAVDEVDEGLDGPLRVFLAYCETREERRKREGSEFASREERGGRETHVPRPDRKS